MNSKRITLYNTLSRKKEVFSPIEKNRVRMYTCGPTVNNFSHIGNLRAYIFADILEKSLEYMGYEVKRVMNITDIGILSSDADSGEDKMTAALLREGKELNLKNMRELAEFYSERYKEDLTKLNIRIPKNIYFASDYVMEDIELVKRLEENKYSYLTGDGVYFDTSKMPDYGILVGGKKTRDANYARVAENPEKKNPEDFALWKFNSQVGFPSPWGQGFPGWHIECSAIGMKFLGEQFDVHTGGIDLIPTHHTNEIAQSESATGKKPFVRFWLHSEHVDIGGEKMAKSEGNFLRLESLIERRINPLAYRFWLLMGHYRTKMNFSWKALEGAESALERLYGLYKGLGEPQVASRGQVNKKYQSKFKEHLFDDLDTPRALVTLRNLIKDRGVSRADKRATILDFDKVLGLGFADQKEEKIPVKVRKLSEERGLARLAKNFKLSDELREKINALGYEVKDTNDGQKIKKN